MTRKAAPISNALSRRKFIQLGAGAAAAAIISSRARAQSYPTRTITMIVFTPAGAIPDIIARLIGEALQRRLGQPLIVENRPGAGGNLALQAVARAPADGHTLLLAASVHTVGVSLYPSQSVTITRDIAPVAGLNRDTFV